MRRLLVAAVLAALTASAFATGNNHAVIIEGILPLEGLPSVDTADELWNDCFLWYELMYNRASIGGDSDRIHMLWGQGSDFRRDGDWRYDPYAQMRLQSITDDSATVSTVESCFNSLTQEGMVSDDTMFVYTWGHGGMNTHSSHTATHFSLKVRPVHYENGVGYVGTHLWDTTFARMCDPILEPQRVFVMQQCRGGGFVDDLNDDKTIIVCAGMASDKTKSCDGETRNGSPFPENETTQTQGDGTAIWRHSEFNFHFMNALRGCAVWSYGTGYTQPESVFADSDSDGVVSWHEAFRYEQEHNSMTTETPVYCDPTAYSWRMESIPRGGSGKPVSKGAALAATMPDDCDSSTTNLWALKGNNTLEFWKYDVGRDSWIEKEDITWLGHKPKDGATLTAGAGGKLYATKGGNTSEFWKYDTATDAWTQGPAVPGRKVGKGASATFAMVDSVPYIYLLKGSSTQQFYRLNIPADTWDTLAWAPAETPGRTFKQGSCIAFDGDTTVYALKGRYNDFYAYSTESGTWTTKSSLPFYGAAGKKVKTNYGAALASCGDWIFAMKGNNSREMWAYDTRSNTWLQAQDVPSARSGKGVRYGGSLVQAGGLVWMLKGNKSDDFYKFAPNRCYDSTPPQPGSPAPGSNERCLAVDGDAEDARWSNSGEYVAYTAVDQDGHRQVFVVSSDSGEPVQLTSLNGECSRPVWSPGDTSIAFEVTPDSTGYSEIAVVPGDSGAVTYLTTSSWDHWHATWSSSGLVGYLCEDSTGYPQVYVKLSTGETPMTQASVEHECPEFASATVMTFAREGVGGWVQIYTTSVGSQSETPITSSSADHANPVPNGGKVYYEVDDAYGYTQVAKVKLQGGAELVLTSGSYDFESPTVNGDGAAIFCTKSDGPGSSVCQVSPTGGYTELTDDDVERVVPHAQPNGTTSISAAYVRDGDVFRLTSGGGGQQSAGLFALALDGAKPNPGRARIIIRWQLPVEAMASLRVYNAAGQLVKVLADGRVKPGAHTSIWNGTDTRGRRLANGVYFCALDNGSKRISRKLVLTD
jgi:Tol biopolymer transport system component